MTSEVTTFYINSGDDAETYLDTMAALSAANGKQYHQFGNDDVPLAAHLSITCVEGNKETNVFACPNSWRTRNAAKMFAKGWKAQLKNAGIKLRDLPKYGRKPRVGYDASAVKAITLGGKTFTGLADEHMEPLMDASGTNWFIQYTDTAGNAVDYQQANTITEVAVTDAAGVGSELAGVMLGTSTAGTFQIVNQYNLSRRVPETLETEAPGPSGSSDMLKLFSTAEELSDDIVEAIDDFGDWRPYSVDVNSENEVQVGQTAGAATASVSYPGSTVTGIFPLGLVRMAAGAANSKFMVTVHSIHEM